jgi:hypothetical protein
MSGSQKNNKSLKVQGKRKRFNQILSKENTNSNQEKKAKKLHKQLEVAKPAPANDYIDKHQLKISQDDKRSSENIIKAVLKPPIPDKLKLTQDSTAETIADPYLATPGKQIRSLIIGHIPIYVCNNQNDVLTRTFIAILKHMDRLEHVSTNSITEASQHRTLYIQTSAHHLLIFTMVLKLNHLFTSVLTTAHGRHGYTDPINDLISQFQALLTKPKLRSIPIQINQIKNQLESIEQTLFWIRPI